MRRTLTAFPWTKCNHIGWFFLGLFLAWVIHRALHANSCGHGRHACLPYDQAREKACTTAVNDVNESSHHSSSSPPVNGAGGAGGAGGLIVALGAIVGALVGFLCVGIVVVVAIHKQQLAQSSAYRRLLRRALLHQMRCHASIPENPRNWKSQRWQAHTCSWRDLKRIACLSLDMVNISGVGLSLYVSTLTLFLLTATLFRIGNNASLTIYQLVWGQWCQDSLVRSDGAEIWRQLAAERAIILLRLYIVVILLYLYHVYRQGKLRDAFDKTHAEMSDYAFLASGFPPGATDLDITSYLRRALCRSHLTDLSGSEWKPEIVGVSVGYDFADHVNLLHSLVDEHLVDVAFSLEQRNRSDSESDSSSASETFHAPRSYASQRAAAASCDDACENSEEVLQILQELQNSGTVIVICRWPCDFAEALEHVQQQLDDNLWEGIRITASPIPCEPPSINWTNFSVGLFQSQWQQRLGLSSSRWLTSCSTRQQRLLLANAMIVGAFLSMLGFYTFLYHHVYASSGYPEQLLVYVVTLSCALGNVLLNQLVWFASQQVGFRLKSSCDSFVLLWYTIVVLTNMCFNFFVICLSAGPRPEDEFLALEYEERLAYRLVSFLRGSLLSYAVWPLFYPFSWMLGMLQLLYFHWFRDRLALTDDRCKWKAAHAMEPPEWYMQYDYAGLTVLKTTSFMCLFVFGDDVRKLFTFDIFWVCCTYFLNKYIYLVLSKETYYTNRRLDTTALKSSSMALGVLAGCVCHWGHRAGNTVPFTISVVLFSCFYLWAFDFTLNSAQDRRSQSERVWYDLLPYEDLQRLYPFNWWNVNPAHMMRLLHLTPQHLHQNLPLHQHVVWQHGKSYLQPDLVLDFVHTDGRDNDSDAAPEEPPFPSPPTTTFPSELPQTAGAARSTLPTALSTPAGAGPSQRQEPRRCLDTNGTALFRFVVFLVFCFCNCCSGNFTEAYPVSLTASWGARVTSGLCPSPKLERTRPR